MSKGLEAFKDIIKIYGETNSLEGTYNSFLRIKKELQALEIIKKKVCFIDKINPKFWVDKSVYNEICTYDYYKKLVDENEWVIKEEHQLTKGEFNSLKEVLCDE